MPHVLTVLSFGGGQESSAIAGKLLFDPDFRFRYAPGDLIFIIADTLNEHPETYRWVKFIETHPDLKAQNIKFIHLKPHLWATGDWRQGLIGFYKAGNRIGSKCFPKSCTDKLKIQPIYKFIESYIHHRYKTPHAGRKRAIKEFIAGGNILRVLIGFAKDEERRVADPSKLPKWQRQIERSYPLIDVGYDRADCQEYLNKTFGHCPPPSNCMVCPFLDEKELLLLALDHPVLYTEWVQMEQNKIAANINNTRNLGVFGEKLLPEILDQAKEKFKSLTGQQLREHRFSHGHNVKTKY